MLHLMRQALADTAAASQDDRPAAGGDVDMVDQCAAARCPGEQEARALGPASHMEARAPDAHRPRCARLPHSARSGAQCAAHGLARVQTAFSTSRTSEVPADLRMGAS